MSHWPGISQDRREAISRATCAAVRLQVEPSVKQAVHNLSVTANDPEETDTNVWDAVDELEQMLVTLGIASRDDIEEGWTKATYRMASGEW